MRRIFKENMRTWTETASSLCIPNLCITLLCCLRALFISVTYNFVSVSVVHKFVVSVVHLSVIDLKSVQYLHQYNSFCQHWRSYAIKDKSLDSFVYRVAITVRWLVVETKSIVLSTLLQQTQSVIGTAVVFTSEQI